MNPIPTWVRRLWDMWDLRILVLLSLTLQIILSVFGRRRRYISSLWINFLVWSAYLMADWVATVALGKLSDAEGNQASGNELWAIWAPLLLLHLGGPNSITAYSLEDNQLWMRHLMGLIVQMLVAVYVILMSWKNLWFSFMSLPALAAGIIKYGERSWVLKSVSNDEEMNRIHFGERFDYEREYPTGDPEYLRVLELARRHLGPDFSCCLFNRGHLTVEPMSLNIEPNISRDAVEVKMEIIYDFLYTKASVIYSNKGLIMRGVSFGCTVTVLLGLIFETTLLKTREEDEGNWHEIDISITWVLIVGALALEIYAAVEIFSSNWMMLWLNKRGKKEWVIWLNQRYPRLFNKKENWSRMMGQFDLLGYALKVNNREFNRSPMTKIIRSVLGRKYEVKWNLYQHTTAHSVHPLAYDATLRRHDQFSRFSSIVTTDELHEIWEMLRAQIYWKIVGLHLATEVCYRLETDPDWPDGGEGEPSGSDSLLWEQNREAAKTLSDYMMYLLIMQPSLLPEREYTDLLTKPASHLLRYYTGTITQVEEACHHLMENRFENEICRTVVPVLKGKGKLKRWEILKIIWGRMLQTVALDDTTREKKDDHFQRLRQGGELLTLIWLYYTPRLKGVDPPITSIHHLKKTTTSVRGSVPSIPSNGKGKQIQAKMDDGGYVGSFKQEKQSEASIKRRKDLEVNHASGSKSSIQQLHEMENSETREEPSQLKLYKETHQIRDGTWVPLRAAHENHEKSEILKNYQPEQKNSKKLKEDDQICLEVFETEIGYAHDFGYVRVKPSESTSSGASARFQLQLAHAEAERRAEAAERRAQQLHDEVQSQVQLAEEVERRVEAAERRAEEAEKRAQHFHDEVESQVQLAEGVERRVEAAERSAKEAERRAQQLHDELQMYNLSG
ncbi:hypothetical protein RHMOL_Rhmol13G0258200 [Rhododendron molle]|uniref:Uncharacterized protein n=1 Tax=Rhododendron molle TaxID=49168 RepID=A0ACC0LAJ1_RHOML|nr:hypothetical protein RHMOL_Rhmol13G0258200 [Rhododendron molle]